MPSYICYLTLPKVRDALVAVGYRIDKDCIFSPSKISTKETVDKMESFLQQATGNAKEQQKKQAK
jgi:hypothetical protein